MISKKKSMYSVDEAKRIYMEVDSVREEIQEKINSKRKEINIKKRVFHEIDELFFLELEKTDIRSGEQELIGRIFQKIYNTFRGEEKKIDRWVSMFEEAQEKVSIYRKDPQAVLEKWRDLQNKEGLYV